MNKHLKTLELDKVLGMLADLTACPDAKEEALNLIPQVSKSSAENLLMQTSEAYTLLAKFGGPSFGGLRNVNNALSRAETGGVLNMTELLDIASVLKIIRGIVTWRSNNAGVQSVLDIYFNSLMPNKFLEEAITTAIISPEEMSDNASPTLRDIRRKIRVQESKVRDQLEKLTRSSSYSKYLQDSIITMRNGRYVVPVKSEHRADISGLVHDTSGSGATVFIEPIGVVEANNEIRVLKSKELDEIERILAELSSQAGQFADSIKRSYESAVMLNVIFAKGQLAYKMKASVPIINDNGEINLKSARHPLIDPKKVVPVNVSLGEEFDTLIITGPNTGGKTVAIKTLGLLSAMAMCGLMLPVADESKISVFNEILCDIGDEQSIEQSLSTFSSHMTTIVDILKTADERSLVLIDELGAGTDPVEGAALATAILEKLHRQGAKIAATTHYAELKEYALRTQRVINGSCEFDIDTLRPTYRLLIGVPGKSNAFAISERLGIDKEITQAAAEYISLEKTRFEEVVEKLEETRREMEKKQEQTQAELRKARREMAEAQKIKAEAEKLREKELERVKAEAQKITQAATREANMLLLEIEKLRKELKTAKDVSELARRAKASMKKGLDSIGQATDPVMEYEDDGEYVLPRPLKVGDEVLIYDLQKQATVTKLADKNNNVEVQAGAVKMRIKVEKLRLLDKKPQKPTAKKSAPTMRRTESTPQAVKSSLDLRGMTVDEAILEVDRFIDMSLRTSLNEFTIIHGKGTGALRSAVQSYLRGSTFVKSFRLGTFGEGESGVTIVELK